MTYDHVRFWHLALFAATRHFVRYWTKADKVSFWLAEVCPLMTQSGHRTVRQTALLPRTYVRGAFFLSFLAYIHRASTLWGRICAGSSINQHRNERGCIGTDAPQRRYCDKCKGSNEEASRCKLQEYANAIAVGEGCTGKSQSQRGLRSPSKDYAREDRATEGAPAG